MDDQQPGRDAARTNQARTEPLPATPESGSGQEAVRRNEELGGLGAAPDRPARSRAAVPAEDAPADAPGVQATRARSTEDGRRLPAEVANAVRGRPDGEVDTRSGQPATGSETP
ncbi:hypothetical protein [Actinorugispora endophytica]|uniref:Uncharacterized protein n=1 Tax=Actinorugispora endophytica TaxID=1605990 RepID=A0A4R6V1G6_9ACTN|nr:hypothetical protein [Actinorugispora endophytica]TDQ53694.1 hypothetical protein EV190_103145 [Actinorugispora endophytica]